MDIKLFTSKAHLDDQTQYQSVVLSGTGPLSAKA
jgi:hypothetical protein